MIQPRGLDQPCGYLFEKDDLFGVGYLSDMSEDGSKYYLCELEDIECSIGLRSSTLR